MFRLSLIEQLLYLLRHIPVSGKAISCQLFLRGRIFRCWFENQDAVDGPGIAAT